MKKFFTMTQATKLIPLELPIEELEDIHNLDSDTTLVEGNMNYTPSFYVPQSLSPLVINTYMFK